jgi:superfamily II DNA or RNA helicase
MNANVKTYLGQKGYTILKSDIKIEQQKQIINDLTIKPYVGGSIGTQNVVTFPAYRESDKKIYVPHYYGLEHFGIPKEYKLSNGEDIDLEFAGILRDYQEPVVNKYIDHVRSNKCGGGLLELPCAWGKCLGKGTKIMMSTGKIELVENIKVGDLIMGDDSKPRKVLSLARGREQMYKISSKKGDEYICNESHILSLKSSSNLSKKIQKGEIIDISVKNFLNLPKSYHGKGGPLLGYKTQIIFKENDVDFDPYLFGFWLGDGSSRSPQISTQEGCIIKYIVELFKNNYTDLYLSYISQYDYRICSLNKKNNRFMRFLRNNNLINNKHIPYEYKCNSRNIQLKVLAGLIDSDGYNKGGCYEIIQKNSLLAEDIVYLCRSLGFACYSRKCKKTCYNAKNGPKEGEYNRISIYGSGIEEIPLLCKRKQNSKRKQIKNALSYRLNIQKLEVDEYYGFEIDGNKRFVLGDFSVTHNTSASLYIISQLKKKTLVIVHKEFLLNQWVERIQQFLPKARIGRIQGQIIDIDDKDIVIGMLQSLSMKEYPASVFDSFGFTIIDEVHHISSQTFSNALFKIVTKYMLGLSATMNRKDGTTRVFKMFLGDVIYKGKRDEERNVLVKAIEYHSNDEEFNNVKTDFRGNVAYSSMISKLCEYNNRSEFILKILIDLLKYDDKQQIIILAHNKNLLKYLHDAIKHRNISTVGYYVGGMKEAALKETENKQVIIATYSMASEGLDIKTLTTLIMATPKTDIQQSVGRILREKHNQPVVVDIIDSHDPFKNQWKKRRAFYMKENYKIVYTTSGKYKNIATSKTNDDVNIENEWTTVFDSKINCKESKNYGKAKNNISNNLIARSITNISESENDLRKEIEDIFKDTIDVKNRNDLPSGKCLIKIKK